MFYPVSFGRAIIRHEDNPGRGRLGLEALEAVMTIPAAQRGSVQLTPVAKKDWFLYAQELNQADGEAALMAAGIRYTVPVRMVTKFSAD
ncbi:MAG: hypothetical protein AB7P76_10590 [Candidatus Melainabacteria bacterium]